MNESDPYLFKNFEIFEIGSAFIFFRARESWRNFENFDDFCEIYQRIYQRIPLGNTQENSWCFGSIFEEKTTPITRLKIRISKNRQMNLQDIILTYFSPILDANGCHSEEPTRTGQTCPFCHKRCPFYNELSMDLPRITKGFPL